MKKLTINELAPYLPYGLELLCESEPHHPEPNIKRLVHLTRLGTLNAGALLGGMSVTQCYRFEDIKPILRPLSDLTKEPLSDELLPIQHIVDNCDLHCDAYDEWLESFVNNPIYNKLMQAHYEIFQELLKLHYDVFGLIEQGLAIDINTIK